MKPLLALLLLTACAHKTLTVQHEYLDRRYLASSYAHTVDPRQGSFCGEMLLIGWCLPKGCSCQEAQVRLTLRFRDGAVEEIPFSLSRRQGRLCYRLLNPKWGCRGGILTYKVELVRGGEALSTFEHQVWAELISVPV
ncbi:MAG: hypothetical protein AB7F31_02960 [Parachlamydiales bacterium]